MPEDRPVIVLLNQIDLRNVLMDHLVQKRFLELLYSPVKVTTEVDGWGIGEVTPISFAPRYPYWDDGKFVGEILRIELIEPLP